MGSFTADDRFLLRDVGVFLEPVEVLDAHGKLLGLFVPANLERCKQLQANLPAIFDREEAKRRMASTEPGSNHEEVWGRISRLETERKRRLQAGEKDFTPDEAVEFVRSLRKQDMERDQPAKGTPMPEKEECPTR